MLGKENEAGKTAILQAFYNVNPIVRGGDSGFDVIDDNLRAYVSDYEEDVTGADRKPSKEIEACFEREDKELGTYRRWKRERLLVQSVKATSN